MSGFAQMSREREEHTNGNPKSMNIFCSPTTEAVPVPVPYTLICCGAKVVLPNLGSWSGSVITRRLFGEDFTPFIATNKPTNVNAQKGADGRGGGAGGGGRVTTIIICIWGIKYYVTPALVFFAPTLFMFCGYTHNYTL